MRCFRARSSRWCVIMGNYKKYVFLGAVILWGVLTGFIVVGTSFAQQVSIDGTVGEFSVRSKIMLVGQTAIYATDDTIIKNEKRKGISFEDLKYGQRMHVEGYKIPRGVAATIIVIASQD